MLRTSSPISRRECLLRSVKACGAMAVLPNGPSLATADTNRDRFNIRMLNPTRLGGRTWVATWDNGHRRVLASGQRDPDDSQFIARGDVSAIVIDGRGTAIVSGDAPRLYVYDEEQVRKWFNVELTFYGMRVSETQQVSSQGFVAGLRSEHQNTLISPCYGQTYYGRLLYDGRVNFQREVVYEQYFSTNKPSEASRATWWMEPTIPANRWVGYKFVALNVEQNMHVRLQLYRDMSGGLDGGRWELVAEYTDVGDWPGETDNRWTGDEVQSACFFSPDRIFGSPGTSVYIRNDYVGECRYRFFSVREIQADPAPYNFENGMDGWVSNTGSASGTSSTDGCCGLSSSDLRAYAGQRSLAVTFGPESPAKLQVFVQNPSVTPGSRVSAYVWIPKCGNLLSVAPFVEDSAWSWVDGWQSINSLVPNSWNKVQVRVPGKSLRPFNRLGIEFTSSSAWNGTCFVDSVGLEI